MHKMLTVIDDDVWRSPLLLYLLEHERYRGRVRQICLDIETSICGETRRNAPCCDGNVISFGSKLAGHGSAYSCSRADDKYGTDRSHVEDEQDVEMTTNCSNLLRAGVKF
jgi:hypothetical protein